MSDQPWASAAAPAPEPDKPPIAPTAPADAPPRGGIAEAIFAEVEQMTAGGAMSKSDAFAAISERTGRRSGTVAANYYRIARKRGAPLEPRVRRGPGRPAGGRRAAGGGDGDAVIRRLEEAVGELAAFVRGQQDEIARLREQSEQFEKLRDWMAKNP
jgi:hypothetical protein